MRSSVREVYPNGGPFAGGTVVSLNVTCRGALSPSELRCRFGRGDGGIVYDFPSVVAAEFADSRWLDAPRRRSTSGSAARAASGCRSR